MSQSKPIRSAGLKSLADHIADNYESNQSAFARSIGVPRDQVRVWLRAQKPIYVDGEGRLWALVRDVGDTTTV